MKSDAQLREPMSSAEINLAEYSRAITNILEDFTEERDRLNDTQTAVLNILDDFMGEKAALEDTKKAALNILDDFSAEKDRLEETQKAVLNILDDFDTEKSKVEATNRELLKEVDERRMAEHALTEKGLALTRSNADLEQFAYVASHDLQEPLRMVSSYVQLLARRYEGQIDEQADKYVRYAVEGATRMQALIGGLLEYSRVARQTEEPVRVSAEAALERALYNLRAVAEETGTLVTRAALPDVLADPAQLAQVFQNLVSNAIKFRRPEAPSRIHVDCKRRGPDFQFSVADNGIGIEARYADRIFVIFQRLHTRNEYPGTGIGLAICKKVVERNGGQIWVESSPGTGSTFHFTLRAAEGPW